MSRKRKCGAGANAGLSVGLSGSPYDTEVVCESWSKTEQYKVKGRHLWTIDDFMRRAQSTEVGDSLCSPVFAVTVEGFDGSTQNLTFQLEVFPNGEEGEDNSDYVAVFLTSRRQEDLEVKYDFSVQKSDGSSWSRIGNTFKKFSPEQNSWGYGKAFSKAKLAEKANELLPGGRLTIICNLEIYYSDRHTEGRKQEIKVEEQPSLGEDLIKAFVNPEFSDVTIVCGESRFSCHKVILTARSDVFAAMFAHKSTTESQTNEVVITDTEPDILEHMLQFIYTDRIGKEEILQSASSLLTAADKYNIPKLKSICEAALCENIDVNNAANILVLAHLHEAKNLQAVAIDFVTNNLSKVTETQGWKVIAESHSRIMNEILLSFTSKWKN